MNTLDESCLSCSSLRRDLKPLCREELCQRRPADPPARQGDPLKLPLLQGTELPRAARGLPRACPPGASPSRLAWDAREPGASVSPAAPPARHRGCSQPPRRSCGGFGSPARRRGSRHGRSPSARRSDEGTVSRLMAGGEGCTDVGWEEAKTFLNTPKGSLFIYS